MRTKVVNVNGHPMMRTSASTFFMQLLASLSCHTLTASLLRQVTQASQAPAAAPATLKAEGGGKQKTSDRKGKDSQAAAQVAPRQTHAELISQMRQADEPLSVGGKLCLRVTSCSMQTSCIHVACLAVCVMFVKTCDEHLLYVY